MGSKKTADVDVRTLSLKELIALQNEGGEIYQKVVRTAFPGREYAELRERCIRRLPIDREKSDKISREYMGLIEQSLNQQNNKMSELQNIASKSYQRLVDAQNKFEKAKKELEKAQQIYAEEQKEFEQESKKRQKVLSEYQMESKKLEDSQIYVLVHPSASLKQLQSTKVGIFVSTKRDKRLLEKAGCVDMVFDNSNEENFVENIPHYMLNALSTAELKNYVAYANMVINFYLQNKNLVAIFASKEISDLLASNGYEITEE